MKKKLSFIFALLFAQVCFSQAPTINGDLLLCPDSNGTATITNAQTYDSYKWYWKYWFTSDPYVEIVGANGPSFIYSWESYDQALLKVVVTLGANTYESNVIQIDSYAWAGLVIATEDTPNVSINPENGNIMLCQGTSFSLEVLMPYTEVRWYKDDELISGENEMQLEVSGPGVYYVVAAPGFCPNSTATSIPIVVETDTSCGLGVPDSEKFSLNCYPNPTNGLLTISSGEPIGEIKLFTISGQLLLSKKPSTAETSIDISSFASGIYFLKAEVNGKVKNLKIVKE